MRDLEYSLALAETKEEAAQLGEVFSDCFPRGFSGAAAQGWPEREAGNRLWLLRHENDVVGGVVTMDLGQYFGGARVPMCGVRLVGVLPEWRARGAARAMMLQLLEQMHELGVPLSMLYPATQKLYRSVGYDLSGSRTRLSMDLATIGRFESSARIVRDRHPDLELLKRTYRSYAQCVPGHLERNAWLWRRILAPFGVVSPGVRVFRAVNAKSETVGYVTYCLPSATGSKYDVLLTDYVALNVDAARSLWAHLAGLNSMGAKLRWNGSLFSSWTALLPEQTVTVEGIDLWMLRLVDVAAALEARTYDAGLTAVLHLAVEDENFARNDGRFKLDLEKGKARVTRMAPGDSGDPTGSELKISARGLASLYSGFQSTSEIALTGRLSGDAAALDLATRIFAGPHPWTPGMF